MQFTDDLAGGDIEGCKPGGTAVPAVVMGAPLRNAGHHLPNRLRPVQGLDLAFFVHAQHQGSLRRIQVHPDDVANLLDKQRIGREFESLSAMRLRTKGTPDAYHSSLRQTTGLGHRADAPVRGLSRLLVQSLGNHFLDHRIVDFARRTGRGSSSIPSKCLRTNHVRRVPAVCGVIRNWCAISPLEKYP